MSWYIGIHARSEEHEEGDLFNRVPGGGSPVIARITLFVAMFLLIANQAWATPWVFQCPANTSCPSSNGSGNMLNSVVSFNDATLDFSWSATYSPNSSAFTPNGFFIVVNNGPMPSSNRQVAILYGDGVNDVVTAYSYDLNKKRDSWQIPANFIGSFSNPDLFTPSGGNVVQNLALNVSSINTFFSGTNPLTWVGVDFGPGVGVWSGAWHHVDFDYNASGLITNLTRGSGQTSWDRTGTAVPVPEPSSLLLLGSGLAGLGFWGRKRRNITQTTHRKTEKIFKRSVPGLMSYRWPIAWAFVLIIAFGIQIHPVEAITIDIDSKTNYYDSKNNTLNSPVVINLEPGTYIAEPIGVTEGGKYNAWNAWGYVQDCLADGTGCYRGWLSWYAISNSVYPVYPYLQVGDRLQEHRYATDLLALQLAPPEITFTANSEVRFFIIDDKLSDNQGGISLHIYRVPEPSSLILLVSGLIGLGGWRRIKKKRSGI